MESSRSTSLGNLGGTDLHHLRVFVTVVESGGFSAAQVTLNVAMSTISRQIGLLESRLSMRLCQRGRVGFRLTDDGEVVYKAAKKLFEALEDFRGTVDASHGRLTGQLSLAVIENWIVDSRCPLPVALARFRESAFGVLVDVHSLAPDNIEHAVLDGRASLGIGVFHRHRPGLAYEAIMDDPVELFCGRGHPLFDRAGDRVSPADLASMDLARRAYLSEEQVAPKTAHLSSVSSAHQVEGVAFMILSGRSIGYLPVHYAARWVDEGLMRSISPGQYRLQTRIEIANRRGVKPSAATEVFLGLLKEEAGRVA